MKFCSKTQPFFFFPQILVISSRQVTDVSIQESFGKIPNLIKKKQQQVCIALDLITQKGQIIKKKTLHLQRP